MAIKNIQQINSTHLSKKSIFFKELKEFNLDVFQNKSWKKEYIESAPLIDEDIFAFFHKFFMLIEEKSLMVFPVPLEVDDRFVEFLSIPTEEEFFEAMEELLISTTGGIAYGTSEEWALYSEADTNILFVGFHEKHSALFSEQFKNCKWLLTKKRVVELQKSHLDFIGNCEFPID